MVDQQRARLLVRHPTRHRHRVGHQNTGRQVDLRAEELEQGDPLLDINSGMVRIR